MCEREPQHYDFSNYLRLADACRHHHLRLQAVMAFHACGGNVGDNFNVPLPPWVSAAADARAAWYLDRTQQDSTEPDTVNREYITLGAGQCEFLPGADGLGVPRLHSNKNL